MHFPLPNWAFFTSGSGKNEKRLQLFATRWRTRRRLLMQTRCAHGLGNGSWQHGQGRSPNKGEKIFNFHHFQLRSKADDRDAINPKQHVSSLFGSLLSTCGKFRDLRREWAEGQRLGVEVRFNISTQTHMYWGFYYFSFLGNA